MSISITGLFWNQVGTKSSLNNLKHKLKGCSTSDVVRSTYMSAFCEKFTISQFQKYMRPLRQPLECTLIDPILADKIFYKVPEILIHHQVLHLHCYFR